MYDVENVFTLLKSYSQELTLGDLFEIRKQTPLKKLRYLSLRLRRGP